MPVTPNGNRLEFAHDLISLPVAARVVYARMFEEKRPSSGDVLMLERLDGAAAAIASIAKLYVYDPAQDLAVTPGDLDRVLSLLDESRTTRFRQRRAFRRPFFFDLKF